MADLLFFCFLDTKERMDSVIDTAYSLAALTYNSYGDHDRASMYASLAISHGVYRHGPDWDAYPAHSELVHEPKSHWSYQARLLDQVKTPIQNQPELIKLGL